MLFNVVSYVIFKISPYKFMVWCHPSLSFVGPPPSPALRVHRIDALQTFGATRGTRLTVFLNDNCVHCYTKIKMAASRHKYNNCIMECKKKITHLALVFSVIYEAYRDRCVYLTIIELVSLYYID